MTKFNLLREIKELKNQLSYSKRYGFFFGAGTSCALGVPDVLTLTKQVHAGLDGHYQQKYKKIMLDLSSTYTDRTINIEDILNHLRQIRAITGEKDDKKYIDISGKVAKELDKEICKLIYSLINAKEADVNLAVTKKFCAWLNMQNNSFLKEIFTSNYDLILEKSLEEINVPYFDGFVGSYEPFFWQESIEKFVKKADLTQNWIRLWKIHGSLNWFWKENKETGSHSIVRGGKINDIKSIEHELVVYPSREKYDSSKKQPFVAYFDRLKNVLSNGELLFLFSGYSFSDQHINEVIFNSLRQNPRLSVLVFCYRDDEVIKLFESTSSFLNLAAFGPKKAIINGTLGDWSLDEEEIKNSETAASFWDDGKSEMILGDFTKLVEFLILNSGKKDNIEAAANGK